MANLNLSNCQESYTYQDGIWMGPKLNLPEDYFKWSEKLLPILKKSPDFVGQIDAVTGKKETFGLMAEKSVRCAIWLKNQGIKSGDVVGYCSKNHLDSHAPLFASFYIGAIFNAWKDDCLNQDLAEYFFDLTGPKVLFVDEELGKSIIDLMPNITDRIKLVVFGKIEGIESFEDILNQQNPKEVEEFEPIKVQSPDTPLSILYTSGTTGKPKGIVHTSGSLAMAFAKIQIKLSNKPSKIGIWFATLCWGSGFLCTIRSILMKSTAIIHNYSDEETAFKLFEKYKITWFGMGTGIANRFYKSKSVLNYDFSSVTEGRIGGGVLSKVVEDFMVKLFVNAKLTSLYGATELIGISDGLIVADKSRSAGRVSAETELKVVDLKTKKILGAHEEGEFWARTKSLMAGYWNNPEATKSVVDSEGWYHTGDLGYYDKDGYVWVIDRITLLIKFKHHRVPSAIIENVIRTHPGVFDVAVIGKPHDEDTEHAMAFIANCPGSEVTEREILELVENELPEHMWLRGGIYFLEKMPYTCSLNKIAKKELCKLIENNI